jgi:hypothetical protein
MHVDIGRDPERDDYGLPPVDIEIPDDARELARDVQAYHRELRAKRRHRLTSRLRGPLGRDGMVLPLLASCLAFMLLAGATLTMFSAGRVVPVPARPTASARSRTPATSQAGALLPDGTAQVDGTPVRLRTLVPSVLALIPSGCGCATAVRRLTGQAADAGVQAYLVGTGGSMTEVTALATRNGQRTANVVDDVRDALGSAYHRTGLTVVMVYANGPVSAVRRNLGPGVQLASSLRALTLAGPTGLASPQRTG